MNEFQKPVLTKLIHGLPGLVVGALIAFAGLALFQEGMSKDEWTMVPGTACLIFGLCFVYFCAGHFLKRKPAHRTTKKIQG